MYFSVEVYKKDRVTFVASCPEMGVFSYGLCVEQAVDRLKQVVQFYIDSSQEMGLSLEELGVRSPWGEEGAATGDAPRPASPAAKIEAAEDDEDEGPARRFQAAH